MKKNSHQTHHLFLITLAFFLLLSACKPEADPTPVADVSSATPILTKTTAPAATLTPTASATLTSTASATATATATHTFTPSPTPFKGFEESVLNSNQGSGALYLFIFDISGVSQPYTLKVKNLPFDCKLDENYVDLLFCTGEPFENLYDDYLLFAFFEDKEMTQLVYEEYFYTGTFKKYKQLTIPGDPDTWCPERGENVTCETEYRMYNSKDGMVECIVSTCYDACGYYYSINSCPSDVPLSDYIFLPPPDER